MQFTRARLAAALVLLVLNGSTSTGQTTPDAGSVRAAMTKATLVRGSGAKLVRTVATPGTAVAWNDLLQTDRSGRIRVVLTDGSLLTLGSESQLRVVKHDPRSQQTTLELNYGRIRAQVAKITRSGGGFELRTPTAVAGVIGTDFGADASQPGATKFVCLEGITRIYTPDKSRYVDCGAGMTLVIGVSGLPSLQPATPDQTERWRHITEPGDPKFADTLQPGGPPPLRWRGMDVSGSWRLRPEAWGWFDAGSGQNTYGFVQSIARLDIARHQQRWGWQLEIAQPSLLHLPAQASLSPPAGQLGSGGSYYTANGNQQNAASIFPSKASISFTLGRDNELAIGRFTFSDGAETVPVNPTLAALKESRIAQRLLGDFQFAVTGRSEDGARLSLNEGATNITLAAARPTRGVFQVDGLGELDVAWEYGALTVPVNSGRSSGELRVFGLGYQDERAVPKTDNRRLAASNADRFANINIGTVGLSYIHALDAGNSGTFDFLLWAAGQTGQWGLQDHRAAALAAEIGWQPSAVAWKPWFRSGYSFSTGDGNPKDDRHETFFSPLPTPRTYARFPFFNQMNNNDAFAMLELRPSSRVNLRSDAHWLWLSSRNDLWYQGGGAFQPQTFGTTGRPGLGARGLGTLLDTSLEVKFSRYWTMSAYFGHVWGRGVEKNNFPAGPDANFGYLESAFRF